MLPCCEWLAIDPDHIEPLTLLPMVSGSYEPVMSYTGSTPLLEDDLTIYPKFASQYHVTIDSEEIKITPLNGNNRRASVNSNQILNSIDLQDVTGCHLLKSKDVGVPSAYFCVYFYPYRRRILGKRCRQRQTVTFVLSSSDDFAVNKSRAMEWKKAITCLSQRFKMEDLRNNHVLQPRHYLVLLNPFSGSGKASQIFNSLVKPMFAEAELDYELIVTERANHARDMMLDLALNKFYGIIIVSGDGLVHEVLNGLMCRTDWGRAVKMPIGVVPAGSGNALSAAIAYRAGLNDLKNADSKLALPSVELSRILRENTSMNFIRNATFIILKHLVSAMDLVVVETRSCRLVSFLAVTWGMVADVDIESEKYRKLGSVRFTVGAVKRILSLKTYRGRLSFKPSEPYVPRRRARTHSNSMKAFKRSLSINDNDEAAGMAKAQSLPEISYTSKSRTHSQIEMENTTDTVHERELEDLNEASCFNANPCPTNFGVADVASRSVLAPTPLLAPLNQPVPDDWVSLEDDFVMVTASYLSHLGQGMILHPDIKFDDGQIMLAIVRRGVSKGQMFSIFGGLEDGSHITNPNIEFIRCHAFRLEPYTAGGILAVDGEVVDYAPIQAQVVPGAARVMTL